MAGSQKVFLRIFAIVGDGDDSDAMPDRVPVRPFAVYVQRLTGRPFLGCKFSEPTR